MRIKPLPIGVDNFEDLISNKYYYIDKTLLIKELLDNMGKVNLFTRPRRFGKTLNMSMLQYFFDITKKDDNKIFDGLNIMDAGEEYIQKMGKYPVINISLKSAKQLTYESAYSKLTKEIISEFNRYQFIVEKLSENKKEIYNRILNNIADENDYSGALKFLSECLYEYYNTKAIILIDEYDVPLENAFFRGFYEEMIAFIRSLLESALKTNDYLEFSVITGCLRISRESIFTGLNNLDVISITNVIYAEHFGFTEKEVDEMLRIYGIEIKKDTVKEWYDGYVFGNVHVYNPWSIVNYVKAAYHDINTLPTAYWANTSSNDIVRKLVEASNLDEKAEIEKLIEGGTIEKPIYEDITYEDIEEGGDNLWNFLFFTGYLKKVSERMMDNTKYLKLAIPNIEVQQIYKRTILTWFNAQMKRTDLTLLYKALEEGDVDTASDMISNELTKTISFYDAGKESFFHGFILGLLTGMENYLKESNMESGDGRPDILLRNRRITGMAIILEFKIAHKIEEFELKCDEALKQIEDKKYDIKVKTLGYTNIKKYGVAFFKKECMIKMGL